MRKTMMIHPFHSSFHPSTKTPLGFKIPKCLPRASLRVQNSQMSSLGFEICNNNQRHENVNQPFLF